MPRYATPEQILQVDALLPEIEAYRTVFDTQINSLAGFIEAYELTFPEEERASIEIRYITSEGRDDEKWRGHLLSASRTASRKNQVNLWLITVTTTQGLAYRNNESIGSFDKQFSLGVDYYYDYDFGTTESNSEMFFNKKVNGFDRLVEEIRTCLPNGAEIQSWLFRRGIYKFTNASTHFAKGDFALKIYGL